MKSKALQESTSILERELREMKSKRSALDSEIYKLELALEKLAHVEGLQRVKRIYHDKVCAICREPFRAKKIDTQICTKDACRREQGKRNRKGIPLIKGDDLKA